MIKYLFTSILCLMFMACGTAETKTKIVYATQPDTISAQDDESIVDPNDVPETGLTILMKVDGLAGENASIGIYKADELGEYISYSYQEIILDDSPLFFTLEPGQYSILIQNLPGDCRFSASGVFEIIEGQNTTLELTILVAVCDNLIITLDEVTVPTYTMSLSANSPSGMAVPGLINVLKFNIYHDWYEPLSVSFMGFNLYLNDVTVQDCSLLADDGSYQSTALTPIDWGTYWTVEMYEEYPISVGEIKAMTLRCQVSALPNGTLRSEIGGFSGSGYNGWSFIGDWLVGNTLVF